MNERTEKEKGTNLWLCLALKFYVLNFKCSIHFRRQKNKDKLVEKLFFFKRSLHVEEIRKSVALFRNLSTVCHANNFWPKKKISQYSNKHRTPFEFQQLMPQISYKRFIPKRWLMNRLGLEFCNGTGIRR